MFVVFLQKQQGKKVIREKFLCRCCLAKTLNLSGTIYLLENLEIDARRDGCHDITKSNHIIGIYSSH